MHLAVLSMALKVPTRQLEALERDDYTAFKGVAFLRALAQSVCRHLDIDPVPVLAGLPQGVSQLQASRPSAALTSTPLRMAPQSLGRSYGIPRQVWPLALAMLLGSAALIWWPASKPALSEALLPHTDAASPASPIASASEPLQALDPVSGQAPEPLQTLAVPAASSAAPSLPTAAVPAASAASTAAAGGVVAPLVVQPRQDIWLEVRDRQARIVIRRQLKAGEVLTQDVAAPFFVYVSKADSTEMRWNGKAVDLLAPAQNNEARLQVRP